MMPTSAGFRRGAPKDSLAILALARFRYSISSKIVYRDALRSMPINTDVSRCNAKMPLAMMMMRIEKHGSFSAEEDMPRLLH